MALKNTSSSYGWPAQLLHWSVAALIVTQFVLAKLAERAADNEAKLTQLALLANHKSVGITIFALALVRICWRFITPAPTLPSEMAGWQTQASKLSHVLLYVFLFALPITGWLMSSASAYTVSWFGLFELPDLVEPSKALKKTLLSSHELLSKALFVVALIHIAAALKHHFIDKDDILKRMTSYASVSVFAVLLTATLWSFATVDSKRGAKASAVAAPENVAAVEESQDPLPTAAADNDEIGEESAIESVGENGVETASESGSESTSESASESTLAAWEIDYAASSIKFIAEQAGANFTGVWPEWQADMMFDPDALAQSKFDVRINVAKVDSRDEERDTTLMEPEWFYSEKFPEARFLARKFKQNQDGSFTAMATLTIKGFGGPVELNFYVEESTDKKVLTGKARLDRLALKVGTGEWTDLEWVGQYVEVEVRVEAKVPNAD